MTKGVYKFYSLEQPDRKMTRQINTPVLFYPMLKLYYILPQNKLPKNLQVQFWKLVSWMVSKIINLVLFKCRFSQPDNLVIFLKTVPFVSKGVWPTFPNTFLQWFLFFPFLSHILKKLNIYVSAWNCVHYLLSQNFLYSQPFPQVRSVEISVLYKMR